MRGKTKGESSDGRKKNIVFLLSEVFCRNWKSRHHRCNRQKHRFQGQQWNNDDDDDDDDDDYQTQGRFPPEKFVLLFFWISLISFWRFDNCFWRFRYHLSFFLFFSLFLSFLPSGDVDENISLSWTLFYHFVKFMNDFTTEWWRFFPIVLPFISFFFTIHFGSH